MERLKINRIPAVIWGRESSKVFLAVHGDQSNKEDTVIGLLAARAEKAGYQVLSFDLPEHGDRKMEETRCKVQNCVAELTEIMAYARQRWASVSLFACSLGAYFSLMAYREETFGQVLFLSPVVSMERLLGNMMTWFDVSEERLENEKEIETPIGKVLYWDYYCYVKANPVVKWESPTAVLYGRKDDLCEYDVLERFVETFSAGLTIVEEGEHFFHTVGQLAALEEWLSENISAE